MEPDRLSDQGGKGHVAATEAVLDATAGVVAHGLLNTMTVISGSAELLRTQWDEISSGRREQLLSLIEVHTAEASQALLSIVRGLPAEALELLEDLSRRRDAPLPDPPVRLRRRRND